MDDILDESIVQMFYFETEQLIDRIESAMLVGERSSEYSTELINEILRAMHSIKGAAATMKYANIAELAHSLEDVFHYLREHKPDGIDYSELTDLVLDGSDFIKLEIHKLRNGDINDGNGSDIAQRAMSYLRRMESGEIAVPAGGAEPAEHARADGRSRAFRAHLLFEDAGGMENVRAFIAVNSLREWTEDYWHLPEELTADAEAAETIRREGFRIWFRAEATDEELRQFFDRLTQLKSIEWTAMEERIWLAEQQQARGGQEAKSDAAIPGNPEAGHAPNGANKAKEEQTAAVRQSLISVNVPKLDRLMDLVGELVIAEAMVTQNPDLRGLQLDNFLKASRQLRKITGEIQDMVMSIRMVPLTATFHKMHRIVRDMSKKLDKEVQLRFSGEETEVDKNIIERISDPLMHVIRNAIDHGIEAPDVRLASGKPGSGTITLEARNAGSDVLIVVRDDGRGLDRRRILERAGKSGLLTKPEQEMTDKEIYALIFLPGFSTKENVSEYSGRGVGMDVAVRNIEAVGGSVGVDSEPGKGSTLYFKIPLTLAIIDGMNIEVGGSRFTIPITAIKESFRPDLRDVITDPDGAEMIMVRGQCYPILRLYRRFNVRNAVSDLPEGIMIMVEREAGMLCLFADKLIGEQQVVIKTLPEYIRKIKTVGGVSGCTLLGDGSISLILNVENLA